MYISKLIDGLSDVLIEMWHAAQDWLDGYLARRWNQQSSLGALLDPLAVPRAWKSMSGS